GTVDELTPYAAHGRAFVSADGDDQPVAYLLRTRRRRRSHRTGQRPHRPSATRPRPRPDRARSVLGGRRRPLRAPAHDLRPRPMERPVLRTIGVPLSRRHEETPGLSTVRERERALGLDTWPRASMSRSLCGYGVALGLEAVSIRSPVDAERRALEELQFRASIHSTRYADVLRANPDAIEVPPRQFEQGLVRVAEDGDGIVGFAVLLPPVDGACELDALFIELDRMRTGIGRLLIDDAVARARGLGANRIEVVADPDDVDFYERVGFVGNENVATPFGP